jgi:hypothetical protein
LLAPGDRVKVEVAGDKDQITAPMWWRPMAPWWWGRSVQASGRTRVEVEGDLRARLIALNMIRDVASKLAPERGAGRGRDRQRGRRGV